MIDDHLLDELSALVDGELAEPRAAELAALIESDAELRAEFDRLRRVADLVRSMPTARANLADDVMGRVSARGRIVRPWAWVGGITAAAAAVLVGIVVLKEDPAPAPTWTQAKGRSEESAGRAGEEAGKSALESEAADAAPVRKQAADKSGLKRLKKADQANEEKESIPLGPNAPEARVRRADSRDAVDVLRRIESKGPSLDARERLVYLQRVAQLEDADLRAHVRRVTGKATPPRPAAGAKSATPGWLFELSVPSQGEASALRRIVERAFRPAASETTASKVRPASVSTKDSTAGLLQYSWSAPPEEVGALVVWLERIGLHTASPRGGVRVGAVSLGEAASAKDEESQAVPVRLRIRYPRK